MPAAHLPATNLPATNLPATNLPDALRDLLDHDLPLTEAADRHFGPDYRQCTDGVWDDRPAFLAHIAHLRTLVETAEVSMLDELRAGDRYAERHVVRTTKADGSVAAHEVFVFARFDADGRFARLEEVTSMREGTEADRGLGNAR